MCRKTTRMKLAGAMLVAGWMLASPPAVVAQERLQTEGEFQELMPITGEVETFFGNFKLDHSFPTKETAHDIYELMDHQRAAQL